MGTVQLPSLDAILQIKDPNKRFEALVETMGILIKNLSEINGYMNSKNLFEAGGWRINRTELASIDKDVGMSTDIQGDDPVRFWAGSADKESAPWNVTKSGKMTATGALIRSKDGEYPYVAMDPEDNLFGAYLSATSKLEIVPDDPTTSSPAIRFQNGAETAHINLDSELSFSASTPIRMTTGDFIYLGDILGGITALNGWNRLLNIISNRTLEQDLNAKATKGSATGSGGSANGGIPIGTVLMVNGGGTVTWNGIPSHTHTQI